MERKAHFSNSNIMTKIKLKINNCVIEELDKKLFILHNNDKTEVLDKFLHTKTSFVMKEAKQPTK